MKVNSEYLTKNRLAYDALAAEFGEKVGDRTPPTQSLLRSFTPLIDSRFSAPSLLELGPGAGVATRELCSHGYEVTCVEFSEPMAAEVLKIEPNAIMIVDEFLEHQFNQKRFDAVLAVAFVHLFPSDDAIRVLKKSHDLLNSRGLILISTTLHDEPSEGYSRKRNFSSDLTRYRRRLTDSQTRELIDKAGFTCLDRFTNEDSEEGGKVWVNYIAER